MRYLAVTLFIVFMAFDQKGYCQIIEILDPPEFMLKHQRMDFEVKVYPMNLDNLPYVTVVANETKLNVTIINTEPEKWEVIHTIEDVECGPSNIDHNNRIVYFENVDLSSCDYNDDGIIEIAAGVSIQNKSNFSKNSAEYFIKVGISKIPTVNFDNDTLNDHAAPILNEALINPINDGILSELNVFLDDMFLSVYDNWNKFQTNLNDMEDTINNQIGETKRQLSYELQSINEKISDFPDNFAESITDLSDQLSNLPRKLQNQISNIPGELESIISNQLNNLPTEFQSHFDIENLTTKIKNNIATFMNECRKIRKELLAKIGIELKTDEELNEYKNKLYNIFSHLKGFYANLNRHDPSIIWDLHEKLLTKIEDTFDTQIDLESDDPLRQAISRDILDGISIIFFHDKLLEGIEKLASDLYENTLTEIDFPFGQVDMLFLNKIHIIISNYSETIAPSINASINILVGGGTDFLNPCKKVMSSIKTCLEWFIGDIEYLRYLESQSKLSAAEKREVERHLLSGIPLVSLILPIANGGKSEYVRSLVEDIIEDCGSANLNVVTAQRHFEDGKNYFGNDNYKDAFLCYSKAYKAALNTTHVIANQ